MRKYQYYNTNDDDDRDIYTANYGAQTFTPGTTHLLGKVKLKLFRVGSPGTATISIKGTINSKPAGGALCSGTLDADVITDDSGGEWYEITLGDGAELAADTMYAIEVKAPDGDASNKLSWRADITSPTFTGGTYCTSTDSAVDWSTVSGVDIMFEEWGVGPPSTTTITWGELAKSQISAEKIEAAVDRLIQNHEDDENAHLEAGESLYSHKASEIIDHIVESIIGDKIAPFVVSQQKLNLDKIEIWPALESLDAWNEAGLGTTSLYLGSILMDSGNSIGEYRKLEGMADYLSLEFDTRNPAFETLLRFIYDTDQIGHFGFGCPGSYFVGFKVIDDELYAYTEIEEVVYDTEITGIDITDFHTYRIVCTSGTDCKFYVDDVLKKTETNLFPSRSELLTPLYYKIETGADSHKRLVFSETRFLCDR